MSQLWQVFLTAVMDGTTCSSTNKSFTYCDTWVLIPLDAISGRLVLILTESKKIVAHSEWFKTIS